jgi:hypothetical protein
MLPGLATTPLGPLILVHCGGCIYARVVSAWTLAEIVGAVLCVALLGPVGLAWSYAFMVWVGLWLMLAALGQTKHSLAMELMGQVFIRPSLYFATASVISLALLLKNTTLVYSNNLLFLGLLASTVVLTSYLLEPDVRQFIKHEEA